MSGRYIVAAGHRIHLGSERFLNPGDEYTPPTPADAVRLAECLIRIDDDGVRPATEPSPAPVEAARPPRSRRAAPVPAVPPADDDAAPEAG